jgi:hypothetical protein
VILCIKVTCVHRRLWLEAGGHNHQQNDSVLNSGQKKQKICEWKCWTLIAVLAERTTFFFCKTYYLVLRKNIQEECAVIFVILCHMSNAESFFPMRI